MNNDTIKVRLWTYIKNFGDGSYGIRFFKTKDAAETYASYDDERCCDDINLYELEFDLEGNLITPDPEIDEWTKKQAEQRWAEELKRKIQKNLYYKELYPDKPELWKCPDECNHFKDDLNCKINY